jgi:co-chaperonin GroES (HSP10)
LYIFVANQATMSSINFKPTRDWVVLPLQTDSGIELVGGAENSLRTNILKVMAAGPRCETVKEGDTVMVHPNSEGLVINLDEGEFVMVNEFSICGVIPS